MKIGIMTYHRACNYGAYLQAFALCSRLNQEEDIDAEIIDFHMLKEKKFYDVTNYNILRKLKRLLKGTYGFDYRLYCTFQKAQKDKRLKKTSTYCASDEISDFQELVKGKYDVVIAGSDEIWKIDSFRGFPTPYWLIGDLNCRKVSYAASSRAEFKSLDDTNYQILRKALDDFEYIGVRDSYTYNEVISTIKEPQKVHLCCDPSFLYDFKVQKRQVREFIGDKQKIDTNKKYVLVMTEDKEIMRVIKKQLKGKYNIISVFHRYRGVINLAELVPFEWLEIIKSVDFVFTSYFHGSCFSIIMNTPFISIGTDNKKSKVEGLFEEDKMKEFYVEKQEFLKMNLVEILKHKVGKVDFSWYISRQRSGFEKFLEIIKNGCSGEKHEIQKEY